MPAIAFPEELSAFRVVAPRKDFKLSDYRLPSGEAMTGPGSLLIPAARSFSTIVNAGTKVLSYRFDEAMRDNFVNARAMKRDAFLLGLFEERILPTINREHVVEVDDDRDSSQRYVRDAMKRILQAVPDFSMYKRALLEAVWFGRAGVQGFYQRNPDVDNMWTYGRSQACKDKKWDPIHGDSVQFTFDGIPAILMDSQTAGWYSQNGAKWNGDWKTNFDKDKGEYGETWGDGDLRYTDRGGTALVLQRPYWRDRFAIHQHIRSKADYFEGELAGSVQGLGLRGMVYWQYVIRTDALTWMLAYMQAVGQMDLLIFNYPAGDAAAKANAEMNANRIIGKAAMACPRNPTGNWEAVEQVQMNSAGLKAMQELVADYFDRHIERLFVGQSMSAGADEGTGLGGTGRAELCKATKDEILVYDTTRLDETITNDLITPLRKYNFPWAKFPVRFKSVLPDMEKKEKVESGKVLVSMNIPIKSDELREAANFSRPEDGDEIIIPVQPGGPPILTTMGADGPRLPQPMIPPTGPIPGGETPPQPGLMGGSPVGPVVPSGMMPAMPGPQFIGGAVPSGPRPLLVPGSAGYGVPHPFPPALQVGRAPQMPQVRFGGPPMPVGINPPRPLMLLPTRVLSRPVRFVHPPAGYADPTPGVPPVNGPVMAGTVQPQRYQMTRYGQDDINAMLQHLQRPDNSDHREGRDDPLYGVRGPLADAMDQEGRGREAQLLREPNRMVAIHNGRVVRAFVLPHRHRGTAQEWHTGDGSALLPLVSGAPIHGGHARAALEEIDNLRDDIGSHLGAPEVGAPVNSLYDALAHIENQTADEGWDDEEPTQTARYDGTGGSPGGGGMTYPGGSNTAIPAFGRDKSWEEMGFTRYANDPTMYGDREGLLAQLRQNPHDRTLRGAFADYLDENESEGGPNALAAFLRTHKRDELYANDQGGLNYPGVRVATVARHGMKGGYPLWGTSVYEAQPTKDGRLIWRRAYQGRDSTYGPRPTGPMIARARAHAASNGIDFAERGVSHNLPAGNVLLPPPEPVPQVPGPDSINHNQTHLARYAEPHDAPGPWTTGTGDEAGFHAAMHANTKEATTPLVYADWLDENGRPGLAAMIRAHVGYQPKDMQGNMTRFPVIAHNKGYPWENAWRPVVEGGMWGPRAGIAARQVWAGNDSNLVSVLQPAAHNPDVRFHYQAWFPSEEASHLIRSLHREGFAANTDSDEEKENLQNLLSEHPEARTPDEPPIPPDHIDHNQTQLSRYERRNSPTNLDFQGRPYRRGQFIPGTVMFQHTPVRLGAGSNNPAEYANAPTQPAQDAYTEVLAGMLPAAQERLRTRILKHTPVADVPTATKMWYDGIPIQNRPHPSRYTPTIAFYDPAQGELVHAPGGPNVDAKSAVAHELFHGLDQDENREYFELSGHPEFVDAWQQEMANGQFSPYAATDEVEGFAELGRLLHGIPNGREVAAQRFPKMYQYLVKRGLA